jgi:hypothetical protein
MIHVDHNKSNVKKVPAGQVSTDSLSADMENLGFKLDRAVPSVTSSQVSMTTTPKPSKRHKRVDVKEEYTKRSQTDERINLVVVGIGV